MVRASVRGSVRSFFSSKAEDDDASYASESEASTASFVHKIKNTFSSKKKNKQASLLDGPTADSETSETDDNENSSEAFQVVDESSSSEEDEADYLQEYQQQYNQKAMDSSIHAKERRRTRIKARKQQTSRGGLDSALDQGNTKDNNFCDSVSIDESYADLPPSQQRRPPPRTTSRHRRTVPTEDNSDLRQSDHRGSGRRVSTRARPTRNKSFEEPRQRLPMKKKTGRKPMPRSKSFDVPAAALEELVSEHESEQEELQAGRLPGRRMPPRGGSRRGQRSVPMEQPSGSRRGQRTIPIDQPSGSRRGQRSVPIDQSPDSRLPRRTLSGDGPGLRRTGSGGGRRPPADSPQKKATCRHGEVLGQCCYEQSPNENALFNLDSHFGAPSSSPSGNKKITYTTSRTDTGGFIAQENNAGDGGGVKVFYGDMELEDDQGHRRRRSVSQHRRSTNGSGNRRSSLEEQERMLHPENHLHPDKSRKSRRRSNQKSGKGADRGRSGDLSNQPRRASDPSRSRRGSRTSGGGGDNSGRRERSLSVAGNRRRVSNTSLLDGSGGSGSNNSGSQRRDRSVSVSSNRRRVSNPPSMLDGSGGNGDAGLRPAGAAKPRSSMSERRERSVSTSRRGKRTTAVQPSLLDSDNSNQKNGEDNTSDSDSSGDYTNRSPKKPQKLDDEVADGNRGRSSSVRPKKKMPAKKVSNGSKPRPTKGSMLGERPNPPSRSVSRTRHRSVSRSRTGEGADIGDFIKRDNEERQAPAMAADTVSTNTGSTGASSSVGMSYITPAWMWKEKRMNMAEVPSPYEEQVDREEEDSRRNPN